MYLFIIANLSYDFLKENFRIRAKLGGYNGKCVVFCMSSRGYEVAVAIQLTEKQQRFCDEQKYAPVAQLACEWRSHERSEKRHLPADAMSKSTRP